MSADWQKNSSVTKKAGENAGLPAFDWLEHATLLTA
jgi:hypothetical protein